MIGGALIKGGPLDTETQREDSVQKMAKDNQGERPEKSSQEEPMLLTPVNW